MNRSVIVQAVGAALIAAISFGGGLVIGQESGSGRLVAHLPLLGDGLDATPASVDLTDFWKAWNTLNANFVETHASSTLPTDKEKVYSAISGLAASYDDPYTTFFPPVESKQFQENISGNFGGIGVEIDTRDGVLVVVTPLKGTPAEAAGIKAGDAIIAIDGKSTEGFAVENAVKLIRGPKGTTVTLTIVRDRESSDIKVVRDTIQVPQTEDGLDTASGVYHIALYEFTATSAKLFAEAFERFKQSGVKLLVLDLRGNPGGYLAASVDIASHFLPTGAVIVTEDRRGNGENDVHRSLGYDDLPDGTKVVILIDKGAASASEILAGALKDNGVAALIGEHSFGKGSVQQLVQIGDGSLKVTVARWLTPSGASISDGGLKVDIEAERTLEDFKAKKDPQMDRAVKFLTTGK